MLTLAAYMAETGASERTVRRWLADGRLPGARMVGRQWMIPADTMPLPDPPAIRDLADLGRATGVRSTEVVTTHGTGPAFWFTVDDLVTMWAPLVSRHAIKAMIRAGEIKAYPRGPGGAWIVPASEARRVAGL